MKIGLKKGFSLIELLVVVAIIGLLASVVLASLNSAKDKGVDASIQSNLKNALTQGEVFYNTNENAPGTYTDVCTVGVNTHMQAAAEAAGLSGYSINGTPSGTTASCNDDTSEGSAWAAEVPLRGSEDGAPKMWCVDSTGKSQENEGFTLASTTDYSCAQ